MKGLRSVEQLPTGNTFSKNSFQYETPLMPGSSNELYSKSFERRGAAQSGLLGSSLNVSPKLRKPIHGSKVTSLSSIFYRGYLLKRSNEPVAPVDDDVEEYSISEDEDEFTSAVPIPITGRFQEPPLVQYNGIGRNKQIVAKRTDDFNNQVTRDNSAESPSRQSIKDLEAFFGVSSSSPPLSNVGEMYAASFVETGLSSTTQEIPITSYSDTGTVTNTPITSGEKLETHNRSTDLYTHSKDKRTHTEENTILNREDPPKDLIAEDRHVWRAKYCIFTDGVLYFYRNQEDADSVEAETERETGLDQKPDLSVDYLSKSPMTRPSYMNISNSKARPTTAIWEKRVALENVDVCRSSIELYGENSFVLLTHGTDGAAHDISDMLVLKARSEEEMERWMRQFQRGIASFVQRVIMSYDSDNKSPMLRSSTPKTTASAILSSNSPNNLPPYLSLSHGHGRSDLHRRLVITKGSPSQSPGGSPLPRSNLPNPISNSRSSSTYKLPVLDNTKLDIEKPVSKYIPPHLRQGSGGKYVPPHLRRKPNSLSEKNVYTKSNNSKQGSFRKGEDSRNLTREDERESEERSSIPLNVVLGGCAEAQQKKKKGMNVRRTESFGTFGGVKSSLRWEVGAVSELGKRNSNEDSFVFASNFAVACDRSAEDHDIDALFAIFDGHCGSNASSFAARNLVSYFEEERIRISKNITSYGSSSPQTMKDVLRNTIGRLDDEICRKSEWEDGSTALVALIIDESIVLANLGDCRAVVSLSAEGVDIGSNWKQVDAKLGDGHFYREVAETHCPSREDEKSRIVSANGWVTHEQEVCLSQLHHIDLFDQDVVDILKRCFSERLSESNLSSIDNDRSTGVSRSAPGRVYKSYRVCGELAVSRALGDRDFKKAFNTPKLVDGEEGWWEGPNFLPYPPDHSRCFKDDLVISKPDIEVFDVENIDECEQFLILACDGLWDVMDPDDAVIVTRDLLYTKRVSAKIAAARLAEIAIHLGSADNTTVIVIRFYRE